MIDEILNKLKNIEPEYSTVLPHCKKTVLYSPFKIKDQKTLSIMAEEQNIGMILKSICDLVKNCSSEKQPELLQLCDLEYLFLQIRSKSVEETINLVLEEDVPLRFKLNIDEIQYEEGEPIKNIHISPNVTIELAYPVVKDYFELSTLNVELLFPKLLKVITIDKHRYDLSLLQTKELKKLADEIYLKHLSVFREFMNKSPKLTYQISHKDQEIRIEGFLRFFT